jgi:ectoine hydroxylase-related dioxygenase (phytanoyl-CoA dioxygenase family)
MRGPAGEITCLFNDKLIFKPTGAIGYEVHRDCRHGTVYPRGVVAVIIPLDPARLENGYTEVFPGYHRMGDLIEHTTEGYRLSPDAIDEGEAVPLELNPGDIALMHCLTPHRSLPNRTDGWRRQLFLSYNAAADGGTCRGAHYAQFIEHRKREYADMGIATAYFQ